MGTHVIVLSESFPMNTNMRGFVRFSKCFVFCAFDESGLGIKGLQNSNPGSGEKQRAVTGNTLGMPVVRQAFSIIDYQNNSNE